MPAEYWGHIDHLLLLLLRRLQQVLLPAPSHYMTQPRAGYWQCSGCLQDRAQSAAWQPGSIRSCCQLLRWHPRAPGCLMAGVSRWGQTLVRPGGCWARVLGRKRMNQLVSEAADMFTCPSWCAAWFLYGRVGLGESWMAVVCC
jgi:hypothetical protein